jgi:hypothetical protein
VSFKVKLNTKSVDDAQKLTQQVIQKVLNNKNMLNELGITVVKDFQLTVKRGQDPDGDKILPPKQDWRERRERLKQFNPVDKAYRRNKAYTFTGQLVNSFKHLVSGPGTIRFRFFGIHNPYKGAKGKPLGKPVSNQELAVWMNKRSEFIGVRDKIIPRLKRIVVAYLRRSRQTILKITKP